MEAEIELPPNGTSLDLLRAIYRSPSLPLSVRMRAAGLAIPYEVPKLAVTALGSEQSFAQLLDARLKRMAELERKQAKLARIIHGGVGFWEVSGD